MKASDAKKPSHVISDTSLSDTSLSGGFVFCGSEIHTTSFKKKKKNFFLICYNLYGIKSVINDSSVKAVRRDSCGTDGNRLEGQ